MTFTITSNLSTVTVSKRNGASVSLDVTALPADMIDQLLTYGIKQKVADASSAEPTKEGSELAMAACIKTLLAGEWSMRGEAASSDPLDQYRIAIVRKIMASPQNSDIKAKYDAIDSSDQRARREFLLDIAAKNAATIDPVAQADLDHDRAQKAQAKALDIAI